MVFSPLRLPLVLEVTYNMLLISTASWLSPSLSQKGLCFTYLAVALVSKRTEALCLVIELCYLLRQGVIKAHLVIKEQTGICKTSVRGERNHGVYSSLQGNPTHCKPWWHQNKGATQSWARQWKITHSDLWWHYRVSIHTHIGTFYKPENHIKVKLLFTIYILGHKHK